MSILPAQNQGSTSSSSAAPSQNPNLDHGILFQPHPSPLSRSPPSLPSHVQNLASLHISDSESSVASSEDVSGSLAPAAADSGGSSKKVTELGVQNSKKSLPHQNTGTRSQSRSVGRGSESTQSRGKLSGPTISPRSQQASGSINFHGSTTHSAGRKTQMNGNHLLNFHYDPISRPQPRAPPPRRQQKIKPYNKDLFLQANYRFVVLDTGNQVPELMDPDKMLQWDDIICVRYSTPLPVQCPICLECPLCPQITSCGHIFCFPCILRYLLMGKEDHKGDCWKKCPLCFVMISPKDLYTLYIENVKQYCVGDTAEFMLLTRQKDSFTLSEKNKQETDVMPCNSEVHDSFSKFIFTSDVDLSVREAISDLDSWLVRADSGLVDDLEKLPYVCAAVEQLEQRKKYWNEHGTCKSTISVKYTDCQSGSHVIPSTTNVACSDYEACGFKYGSPSSDVDDKSKWLGNLTPDKLDGGECLVQTADMGETLEGQCRALSSSYDENKSLQRHSSGSRDLKDDDSYNFYQAVDGQHLILHPLNMKCLLHHYGGYAFLPNRISGRILQLETVTQSEAMRRRYRYLSHFSLTTTFQLCEIDLREVLPPSAFFPFMDEIKKRERQRKKLARKDTKEKLKAEATTTDSLPIPSRFGEYVYPPTFSIDDFEALGSPVVTSTSPPTFGERKLFSNVTKLGFAAGHDSPGLKIEEVHSVHSTSMASDSSGSRNAGTPSFANVISRGKSVESLDASKTIGTGKKGKKSNQILLSTAGGRRY
ncbi:uncharacterized protein LOC100248015 isoform X2 [Vitis vinifera]|uniref:uncharacterized protein LOC100248015 isoform X2 n=1 Tax=Vitis vinifera TaxID=29760 RepID=UPI00053FFAE1|nr:uncharacterized protein LOC100248015 isoform X2 [Vitis vinifera]|eukprot:XP_010660682.1 PREDICTED: RING finger protein 10 isoform X2 [Vitis vinifera]